MLAAACAAPAAPPVVEAPSAAATTTRPRFNLPVGVRQVQTDTDLCKAEPLQWLVGRARSEIPVPVDVVSRRVACTTCPLTEDFDPYRLNILYDRDTGLVRQVRCG